jgi:hypothetical protein
MVEFTHNDQTYTIPSAYLEFALNEIRFNRLRARMYDWLKTNPSPTSEEFQTKLSTLNSSFQFHEGSKLDAVELEARTIASDLIRAKLAELGLPTPRDSVFNQHIDQLIGANPSITERARQQVEARMNLSEEILGGSGN